MGDGVGVFLIGLLGVFTGMAFLYLSIKLTGRVVSALESGKTLKETTRHGGDK
ncbi:OadG family protein [uncultured Desulfobacter sp.]|uniref:OadG family protein n=1 Tax=uncultured Desulfobacter sp. TaxID=240139 RepID=UPI0029F4A001|nr:OadG family protein [uncultured Desulfobacter sp.]